ncbi:hypothetical protein VTO42DRAFT_3043 [Malbranchea cinnamomea]
MESHECVKLQVGERHFHTTVGALTCRSDYFKALFSGRFAIRKQNGGSIFIDANPTLFEYILDYLRRGVFPFAFSKEQGHDYVLYERLLEEAKYFQCRSLIIWLEDKCYHQCFMWSIRSHELRGEPCHWWRSDSEDRQVIPCTTEKRKIYLCPRGIECHRGDKNACGYRCRNALATVGPEYDTMLKTSSWLVVERGLQFNRSWATDNGTAFVEHLKNKNIELMCDEEP